jgi:4-hydroxy-tetrahydrodipicolinate synthase
MNFTGVFPILATPFCSDESFDNAAMQTMLKFMQDLRVDGVTVLGVLGEANRMTDHEREQIIRCTVQTLGESTPVIVGVSHPGTNATIELAAMAAELGAHAVMVTPSAEAVPNDARIAEYFGRICAASKLPVVLQDHPASSGVHMAAPLIARIVDENPSIACVKAEAVPSPPKIALLRGLFKRQLPMLTGLGGLYGQFDLEAGSSGYNTGFAFPEVLQAQVAAQQAGDIRLARRIWSHFLPLMVFEQQPGVAVRKELLRQRGLLGTGTVRHPGAGLQASAAEGLKAVLDWVMPGVDLTKPLDVNSVLR